MDSFTQVITDRDLHDRAPTLFPAVTLQKNARRPVSRVVARRRSLEL